MAARNFEESLVERIRRALMKELQRLRHRSRLYESKRRGGSAHRIALLVALCALLPVTAWSENTRQNRTELAFDAERRQVTVRVSPRDLRDVRLPFPVRQQLGVLDNGVPQPSVTVDVEHTPITVSVLVENGGRSHQLNETVRSESMMLLRPLLDVLDSRDRLALFSYNDSLHSIVDFDAPRDTWRQALANWPQPKFSESNFYDAVSAALDRLETMPGPKALLVMSTGLDTFSRTSFADVAARAERAQVPVYVFNLGEMARRRLAASGLVERVDWARCTQQLERLARASGGRVYATGFPEVAGIHDEIVEELKVRYVLTYTPTVTEPRHVHAVQIVLKDFTSKPQASTLAEASRRRADIRVIAEAAYTPVRASAVAATTPVTNKGGDSK